MTKFKTLLLVLMCVSCAESRVAYVQKGLVIAPPVKQANNGQGPIFSVLSDGGTTRVKFTDSRDRPFEVFIDHREGRVKDWGTYYINGYPGRPESIRVTKPLEFEKKIMKDLQTNINWGLQKEGQP